MILVPALLLKWWSGPDPGQLLPSPPKTIYETVFLIAVFFGSLIGAMIYASKKGLRMFATGVPNSVFESAVREGKEEHAGLRKMYDELDERLNDLDKEYRVTASEFQRCKSDVAMLLERRRGR